MTRSIRASVDLSQSPKEAFESFVDELKLSLQGRGMTFDGGSVGSKIVVENFEVGTIQEWVFGERISILWHPKAWEKQTTNRLNVTFVANGDGSTVAVEHEGWGRILGDDKGELLGWFASELVAPLFWASAPSRLGDWVTDRFARRPSGPRSRGVYSNPIHHWPNFLAILDILTLGPNDNLLEVGCGGGAFLHEALKTGCRACAIDHSEDMVRLAIEKNRDSIVANRLRISMSEAHALPYANESFTCAVMTGVLGFLSNPFQVFKEVFRVLRKDGRFVAFTGSKELRGTPAAPEPVASRLHFYEDQEIEDLARRAGFTDAKVKHPSLFEYAKKAGVPEPDLGLFRGTRGSQLLIAQKT